MYSGLITPKVCSRNTEAIYELHLLPSVLALSSLLQPATGVIVLFFIYFLIYFLFNNFQLYFYYHLVPLCTLLPAITTQQSMSMSPFSFLFNPSISYPAPSLAVICSPSMSLFMFSLLVQFVHQIPHMSEVIWYLSFSDWLISLSIMFSRSIHTVAKGKIFFFQLSSIPLCKCPQLFYLLFY